MAERGRVKIQRLGGKGTQANRTRKLTVPAPIAQQIPDGSEFIPEITDEGLLYRPVNVPPGNGPRWLREGVSEPEPEG